MTILTAGPWTGEFGWELFCWQGALRHLALTYDKVIIASRPGHKLLYKDFCHKYIPCAADMNLCSAQHNYAEVRKNVFRGIKSTHHLNPKKMVGKQLFIKYGKQCNDLKYDVVMHAREIQKKDGNSRWGHERFTAKVARNWDRDKWSLLTDQLVAEGLRVCCIGHPSAAFVMKKADNLTGISLRRLADVLASSRLTIGPSSGPMHFASLCGCPHYVWTAPRNKQRYQELWNPHHTPVKLHIDKSWNPDVNVIFKGVKEYLNVL